MQVTTIMLFNVKGELLQAHEVVPVHLHGSVRVYDPRLLLFRLLNQPLRHFLGNDVVFKDDRVLAEVLVVCVDTCIFQHLGLDPLFFLRFEIPEKLAETLDSFSLLVRDRLFVLFHALNLLFDDIFDHLGLRLEVDVGDLVRAMEDNRLQLLVGIAIVDDVASSSLGLKEDALQESGVVHVADSSELLSLRFFLNK